MSDLRSLSAVAQRSPRPSRVKCGPRKTSNRRFGEPVNASRQGASGARSPGRGPLDRLPALVPGVAAEAVDLDIADRHELDVRRFPVQTQAECLADGAAATVAAGQVLRPDLRSSYGRGHAVGVL